MTGPSQLADALAGRYEIVREIGEGGMATVFLARDVKHHRNVALKVLKPELGVVLGSERFLSEIRVTANLQHPNLLPLFDSGEAEGLLFYVMPFVEGESLRARLEREKQLPIDEAVRISAAIAGALDYAHRHGVIHRDLKPENVLLHDGQPLIADFGIALAVSNAGGARVTQTGLSLGTPQYMSPEQATGDRNIDGRTDIYSLGALTYEMLAGEPPHSGTTAQAIIARLMTEEPRSLSAVRRSVPAHVEAAVRCALEKLPADRFATAKEFSDALQGRSAAMPTGAARTQARASSVRQAMPWAITGIATMIAIAAGSVAVARGRTGAAPPVRFRIEPPTGVQISRGGSGQPIAISRDGAMLAFVAGSENQLYLRRLNETEAFSQGVVDRVSDMRFSSDGKWIAYKGTGTISKVAVDAPNAKPISLLDLAGWEGLTWTYGPDVVYALGDTIWRIGSDGRARAIAGGDTARFGRWTSPILLPDGKTIAVRVNAKGAGISQGGQRLGLIGTAGGEPTIIDIETQNVIGYVDGILVFGQRGGRILATRFDLSGRKLIGEPVAMLENAVFKGTSGVSAVLSDNGTLAYMTAESRKRAEIVNERGGVLVALPEGHAYGSPVWSPDGRQIAISASDDAQSSIWTFDPETRVLSRLVQGGSDPAWHPDGKRIAFLDDGKAQWINADGSGVASAIPGTASLGARRQSRIGFTSDGRYAIVGLIPRFNGVKRAYDREPQVVAIPLAGGAPVPVVEAAAQISGIEVSPDGRWLAYTALENGRLDVYITSFPSGAGRVQVTSASGAAPRWSRDGSKLFYRGRSAFEVVSLDTRGAMPRIIRADSLFGGSHTNAVPTLYDVHPDGKRFVISRDVGEGARIVVVMNWLSEVRAKLGNRD